MIITGAQVIHRTLGSGTVLSTSGSNANVSFDSGITKSVVKTELNELINS